MRVSPAHDRFLRIGDPLDITNLRLIAGNLLSRSTKVWLMLAAATVLVFGIASHVFSRSTRKRDHE